MATDAAPAFLCCDAGARDLLSPAALDRGQLPAFDHRQFAGCVDGARIGAVAVDQNAVAAAPPDRHRDRIDQLAQARGFVVRLPGERRDPAFEQPQNRLAGRRPSPFDRERAAAAQADGQREGSAVALQYTSRGLEQGCPAAGELGQKFRVGNGVNRISVGVAPDGPAKGRERHGVEHRRRLGSGVLAANTRRSRVAQFCRGPQQQSAQRRHDNRAKSGSELDHGFMPHLRTIIYRRSLRSRETGIVRCVLPKKRAIIATLHS
jgi:hypothetical protein